MGNRRECCDDFGHDGGFSGHGSLALIVVLFILLIIVGAAFC